jgi:hypothetical protein
MHTHTPALVLLNPCPVTWSLHKTSPAAQLLAIVSFRITVLLKPTEFWTL